ncbi:phosphoribosyl-AMP cyclohydrolase [Brevibacterium rongguiense]
MSATEAGDASAALLTGGGAPTAEELSGMLAFGVGGLLPAVVQEARTGEVLMLAWMDAEALARTLRTRRATYWSRSRGEYWVKGETSGHTQRVEAVRIDCDADTVLLSVAQTGPACHTGTATCFTGRELPLAPPDADEAPSADRAPASHAAASDDAAPEAAAEPAAPEEPA